MFIRNIVVVSVIAVTGAFAFAQSDENNAAKAQSGMTQEQKDKLDKFFSSSKAIVDTYNAYKDDPAAMRSVYRVLRFYGAEFGPKHLGATAGSDTLRDAVKKYVISRQGRTDKMTKEELAKLDMDADYSANSILNDKCLFGVGSDKSVIYTTTH